MASNQPVQLHESWTDSLKEVESGNQDIKSSRVVEAIQEWSSAEWVNTMEKPTSCTPLPDIIAMLWDIVLHCMMSFGFKWADWQEPTTLQQQLKGLTQMVCHQRLWMTLVHSPAAKQVQQAVNGWFKQLVSQPRVEA
jgi:hypothetical protein